MSFGKSRDLGVLETESQELIVISTGFDPAGSRSGIFDQQLTADSHSMLRACVRGLRVGGLLFVYGLPHELVLWGESLLRAPDECGQMIFKYWIALEIDDAPRQPGRLKSTHLGLLLFYKSKSNRKTPVPFRLNTKALRIPHAFCGACGLNLKDWGGKKHLMNPRGAAPSDVWRDLPKSSIESNIIPDDVLSRIQILAGAETRNALHVIQKFPGVERTLTTNAPAKCVQPDSWTELKNLELDRIYEGDCIPFLEQLKTLYPEGIFDLAFADPPYNLEKKYDTYADALAEQQYIKWCNAWLAGMADNLKPGGSLFVLNLPKWAIHHAAFLNRRLEFRNWIVWDALSDPRGKLMPAHYALLYYTKPGGEPVFNYNPAGGLTRNGFVDAPDSSKYCFRAKCIKERKCAGDDAKVELSDIWFDIFRIKHKRDRDSHPCQLPERLLDRIIKLTTRPGDLVFDPFCGAGTTPIAAARLGRKYVAMDVDANYVHITNQKLAAMRQNKDLFGQAIVPRISVARPRKSGSKRGIETYLQNLARRLNRVPTEQDVEADQPGILQQIDMTYSSRGAAFKRAKIGLVEP